MLKKFLKYIDDTLLPEIFSILKTKRSKEKSSASPNPTSSMKTDKGEELCLAIEY